MEGVKVFPATSSTWGSRGYFEFEHKVDGAQLLEEGWQFGR